MLEELDTKIRDRKSRKFWKFFFRKKGEHKIKLENNKDLEKISILRRLIDFFWIPFLNYLPKKFGEKFLSKFSKDAGSTKEFATTYKAIEILYKFNGKLKFKKDIKNFFMRFVDAIFTWVWQNVHHVQSVRNRLKIIKYELSRIIKKMCSETNQVVIVSLGAGSARGVLETTKELNGNGFNTKIVLIDKSPEALDYSRQLGEEFNISHKVEYKLGKVEELNMFYENNGSYPQIIEMVGLGDYFDDQKLINFFITVFTNLEPGGYFIVSNIIPNRERPFVENIVGWRGMYYRQPEELKNLLIQAGFQEDGITLIIEPIKIHTIIIVQKLIKI